MSEHAKRAVVGDRALFPQLRARAYLNHAAVSPPSLVVRQAVQAVLDDYAADGVHAVLRWVEQRNRLRGKLATLVGAQPSDIGFCANTTAGVTAVALCTPYEPGDRIVVLQGEFPANVTPWQRAAELHGLQLRMLPVELFGDPDPQPGLDRLDEELARGVAWVAASAVQFQTGLRMPLRAMAQRCHAHGARLFVDAIQAAGAVPLDVEAEGIDAMSCGSHKWLMGLEGAAFVVLEPTLARSLRPWLAGWLSHENALSFLFEGPGHLRYDRPLRRSADMFEAGAPNTTGLAALEASVDLIAGLGVDTIFTHVQRYLDALEPQLVSMGFSSLRSHRPEARSCILSVDPPPGVDVVHLHAALVRDGISCTIPDGRLRFSPHWPNALDEVPVVVDTVRRAVDHLV